MATQLRPLPTSHPHHADCDPATRLTRSLLGYGVIAGPLYVAVSLAQAVTRDGFRLDRHAWSLLSNGDLGWIQITNFLLTGAMVIAFAIGLSRRYGRAATAPGVGRTRRGPVWAARLIGGYGASLLAAGILRADPALGFPTGTPDGPGQVTWHGAGHLAAGALGFTCLVAACLLLSRWYAATGQRAFARFCAATGGLFLAGFLAVAAATTSSWAVLSFTAAVVLSWTWLSLLAVRAYRSAA